MKENLHRFVDQMIDHNFTIDETVSLVEKIYIEKVLHRYSHNISAAARHMQIHRNTLTRKIKSLQIQEAE